MTKPSEPAVAAELIDVDHMVLGTVQLGLPYGRRRTQFLLDDATVEAILDRAWSHGIRTFDTSEEYGEAATRLATWLVKKRRIAQSRIVTKVRTTDCERKDSIERVCNRFTGAASVMVLTHGAVSRSRFERFNSICQELGLTAGQSVYSAEEVEQAAQSGALRVQAPVNVLDLRQLHASRRSGIPIDARSVFLQGVLVDDPELAERRVQSIGSIVRELQDLARDCGATPADVLFAAVINLLEPNDRAVLGVESPDQIDVVPRALALPKERVDRFLTAVHAMRSRATSEPRILDPRRWSS